MVKPLFFPWNASTCFFPAGLRPGPPPGPGLVRLGVPPAEAGVGLEGCDRPAAGSPSGVRATRHQGCRLRFTSLTRSSSSPGTITAPCPSTHPYQYMHACGVALFFPLGGSGRRPGKIGTGARACRQVKKTEREEWAPLPALRCGAGLVWSCAVGHFRGPSGYAGAIPGRPTV